ncbi:MAG: ATP-binding protein [Planctomycetaceae bacterium]|nr:ATP-binding protein [Planctomycetaceae bacterium]
MQDYEKLGVFYLGREYDLAARQPRDGLILYESKDLTTHAVCVGMTGSGKTGLCLSLLEEAAIDGIPVICIDPKGDLGNLLLTFPELAPEQFQPWVDPRDAMRKGLSVEECAKQTAQQWKQGLADWQQDGTRIARFRDSVDIAIYTPGSDAGLPLTVLKSFAAPPPAVRDNGDAYRERISAAAAGLLALVGIQADPLRSREHILLSTLFDKAWQAGQDVDFAWLIRNVQSPPFDTVGFLDLESFFPAQDRFALAMSFNNLVASPGFSAWMTGEPLDIQRLYFTPEGKPRLTILSIAHLSEAERMFFVTIFLNELLSWVRSQSGTSSLRALFYMDEVFGYFPPTANPPSKTPMLTLLKQARAYGLGVVLATQNPVDLDYKGLSNTGTWFLGRLQTERDKLRVLEGLEGASTAAGSNFDRAKMEATLAGLGNRVFLMNNVHDDAPVVFQTRWALSYLRGPITREQIARLMAERKARTVPTAASGPANHFTSEIPDVAAHRPVLPPGVVETFLSARLAEGCDVVYRPGLLATARVHYQSATVGLDSWEDLVIELDDVSDLSATMWDRATMSEDGEPPCADRCFPTAGFATLPPELSRPKSYADFAKTLKEHIFRTRRVSMWRFKPAKLTSQLGETEGDFRTRVSQALKEERDLQVQKLRTRYAGKVEVLQERRRKAGQRVEKEKSEASQQTMSAALSFGTSILGAIFGRKLASSANANRAATSMRAAGRAAQQRKDIQQAEETVEAIDDKIRALNAELEAEVAELEAVTRPDALELEEAPVRPKRTDISVTKLVLLWIPYVRTSSGGWERGTA